jgi:hypothetical protein
MENSEGMMKFHYVIEEGSYLPHWWLGVAYDVVDDSEHPAKVHCFPLGINLVVAAAWALWLRVSIPPLWLRRWALAYGPRQVDSGVHFTRRRFWYYSFIQFGIGWLAATATWLLT